MATVCCGPWAPTKVVVRQSQSCVHSSSRVQRALLPPCKLSGLSAHRIGGTKENWKERGDAFVVRMGIRAVESFDATFQLTPEDRGFKRHASWAPKNFRVVIEGRLILTVGRYFKFGTLCQSDQLLRSMLMSESFIKQVARDCSLGEDVKPEFSGEIFQPVPWSQTTKHGMLAEYEKYYHDKENYVIVNVPPQIMFKAKIFKPSRLCAIFKKSSSSS